jgi:hypothetical protein
LTDHVVLVASDEQEASRAKWNRGGEYGCLWPVGRHREAGAGERYLTAIGEHGRTRHGSTFFAADPCLRRRTEGECPYERINGEGSVAIPDTFFEGNNIEVVPTELTNRRKVLYELYEPLRYCQRRRVR